uniref:Uncharacterized protein n=1 Tax=Amphimedon queenslandica TaxID=400682 RepID=A0A1X7SP58_AMPQE
VFCPPGGFFLIRGFLPPGVFLPSGGKATLLRLAILHSEKFQRPYNTTINLIRCQYSFAILKAAVRSLRGSRSRIKSIDSNDFCRAISEARLTLT